MKEKRKNPQNSGQAQPRRKEKGTRYTKYEIKEQKYQPILQKYKNNVGEHNIYMPTNLKTQRKQTVLETYSPPKLNQEEIDNLNCPITGSEIEPVIKQKTPYKENFRPRWLHRQIL